MKLMNKKTIVLLVLVLIVAVFVVQVILKKNKASISYKTSKVDRGEVVSIVSANGTIKPISTIEVGTQVSGTVDKIYVDFNSEVKKGEPLAELDQAPLKTVLKRAEANNKKAKADYNIADSLYKTNKELYEKRLIPKEEFDDSKAKYSSALAAYDQSKVDLEIARSNLDNTVIKSPIDGMVLSKNINLGESVNPGGRPLFEVVENLAKMKLDINVSEVHIGKIQRGQNVDFYVDAYPNKIFHGVVSQVRDNPTITNDIVTYNVVVELQNDNFLLKPGMTAEAKITVADKKNALRVPTAALRYIPPSTAFQSIKPNKKSNGSNVWVLLQNGQLSPVSIKIGVSNDMYTEVTDGDLRSGQAVVVESSSENNSVSSNSYLPQPGRF